MTKTFGDDSFTYIAKANEGNPAITYTSSDENVATIGRSTGTVNIVGTGQTTITAAAAEDGEYAAAEASYTLKVNPASMVVEANGYAGKYDGQAHGITVTAPEGAIVKYRESESGDYDLTSSPQYTDAGTYTVYYKVTKDNYTDVTGSKVVEIEKADLGLQLTLEGWTYGSEANEPVLTGNDGNAAVNYYYKKKGAGDNTYSSEKPAEAGEYTLKAAVSEIKNYNSAEANVDFTISKAEYNGKKTDTVNVFSNKALNNITYALPAPPEGASYGSLSLSNDSGLISGTPSIADGILTYSVAALEKEKTSTITIPVTGANNYRNYDFVLTIVTADKEDAEARITGWDKSLTYGADPFTLSGTVAKAGAGSGTWIWNSSAPNVAAIEESTGRVTIKGAGTATITGHYESDTTIGDDSIEINVEKASLLVKANDRTIIYGDSPDNDGVTYSGFKNGDAPESVLTGELNYSYNYTQYGNAGSYDITPSGLDAANYSLTYEKGILTVTQKEVGLEWGDKSFVYDGSSHAPAVTITGTVNGDACSATVTGGKINVGNGYIATVTGLTGDKADNYKLPAENTTVFAITKAAPLVKKAPEADSYLVYTGLDQELISEGESDHGEMQYALGNESGATDPYASSIPKAANSGTYHVWYKIIGDDNHKDSAAVKVDAAISKAALEVTAKDNTITYGDEPMGNGVEYNGFKNDETESVLSGTIAYSYDYSKFGDVGDSYRITPSGLSADNYDIAFSEGKLTVNQKEVGIAWTDTSFTYDGNAHVPSAALTGLVNSDECGLTIEGEQTKAGNSYTAVASGITGSKAQNYKLPIECTTDFVINPRTLGITWNDTEFTYDKSEHAPTVTIDGIVENDKCVVGVSGKQINAGTYTATASLDGEDRGNYTLPDSGNTQVFTIRKADITPVISLEGWTYGNAAKSPVVTGNEGNGAISFKYKGKTEEDEDYANNIPEDAGSYTVKAEISESDNYKAGTATADFVIGKAEYNGTKEVSGFVWSGRVTDNAELALPVLPEGASYAVSGTVGGENGALITNHSISGTKLRYSSSSQENGASATITIPVTGARNYNDYSVVVTVAAKNKDDAGASITGGDKTVTFGEAGFTLIGTIAKAGENGTWEWSSSDAGVAEINRENGTVTIKKAGNTTITASYESDTTIGQASITLTVNKAAIHPVVAIEGWTYDGTVKNSPSLGDSSNPGNGAVTYTYAVKGSNSYSGTAPKAAGEYTLRASIEATDNYEAGEATVDFTIAKADPQYENPTGLKAAYGNKLNNIVLPAGWEWYDGSTDVGSLGEKQFPAVYTPEDKDNYNTLTVALDVTVEKAASSFVAEPVKKTISFTGSAQELITNGTASGGILKYALGNDTEPDAKYFAVAVPRAIDAGDYIVWYKVTGDANHDDSSAKCITVTISKSTESKQLTAETVEVQSDYTENVAVDLAEYGINDSVTVTVPSEADIFDATPSYDSAAKVLSFKLKSGTAQNSGRIEIKGGTPNYSSLELTIPVEIKKKTSEVRLERLTNVESSIEGVSAKGLSDFAESRGGENDAVEVVMDIKTQDSGGENASQINTAAAQLFASSGSTGNDSDIKKEYVDISVREKLENQERNIAVLDRVIGIRLKYNFRGKYKPHVIRSHGEQVKVLKELRVEPRSENEYEDGTFFADIDKGLLWIFSQNYSTIAIVYTEIPSHALTFEAEGAEIDGQGEILKRIVNEGATIGTLPTVVRSGYDFKGWFTSITGGDKVTKDTVFGTEDTTYYAQWAEKSSAGGNPGGSPGGGASGGSGGGSPGGGASGGSGGGSSGGGASGGSGGGASEGGGSNSGESPDDEKKQETDDDSEQEYEKSTNDDGPSETGDESGENGSGDKDVAGDNAPDDTDTPSGNSPDDQSAPSENKPDDGKTPSGNEKGNGEDSDIINSDDGIKDDSGPENDQINSDKDSEESNNGKNPDDAHDGKNEEEDEDTLSPGQNIVDDNKTPSQNASDEDKSASQNETGQEESHQKDEDNDGSSSISGAEEDKTPGTNTSQDDDSAKDDAGEKKEDGTKGDNESSSGTDKDDSMTGASDKSEFADKEESDKSIEKAPERGYTVSAGIVGSGDNSLTVSYNQSILTYNGTSLKKQIASSLVFMDKNGNKKEIKRIVTKNAKNAGFVILKKVQFVDGSKLTENELSGIKIEIAKRAVSSNNANPQGAEVYAKFDSIKTRGSKYLVKVILPIWNKNATDTSSSNVKGYKKKKLSKSDIGSIVKNEKGELVITFAGNYTGTYVTGN